MDQTLRGQVWQRANGCCEYCQLPQEFDMFPFQIDHVIAEKHHGQTVEENLALSCYHCNIHKGPNIAGIGGEAGETTRLFHPRRDRWLDHFEWHGPELVGLTAIGRVTIDVLNINTPVRWDLRHVLIESGSWLSEPA
ncbi:MAG: HNH endonuclease [Planctomycetales bacterium]|nr:HNH endonuclease [Planctomycetales bacterium]